MTQEEEIALHNFEALVRRLMAAYTKLRGENARLKESLAECRQQLDNARARVAQAESDYAALKTARMIEVSGDDVKASRARISKLIREVDKCIALLNV